MAEDTGSPDYYPIRWKVADAAEDLFVLHRGKVAAFIILLLAGLVIGFFLFFDDDDSDVDTAAGPTTTIADGDAPSTTADTQAPDQSSTPTTAGPETSTPSTTTPPSTPTTGASTTTTTTTTTTVPVSPRAPIDAEQLANTEPGAVLEMEPNQIRAVGGLPNDALADETLAIAQATFTGTTVADEQIVDAGFPVPEQLLFRLSAADLFDYNRDSINPTYLPLIDRVAAYLVAQPNRVVEVAGHTDSEGPSPGNQRLSERRAASAATYLISQGVESSRVTTVGYGEDRPIESNDTEAGRLANRRIEFVVGS